MAKKRSSDNSVIESSLVSFSNKHKYQKDSNNIVVPSSESKQDIRSFLLKKRLSLTPKSINVKSNNVSKILFNIKPFAVSKKIALYFPIKNEVKTQLIFQNSRYLNKDIYLPRVNGSLLDFYKVKRLSDLKLGSFNVPEPDPSWEKIDPLELDLIIIPGVGFDVHGNRLGYGKGFYDRVLSGITKKRIYGLSYSFQVLDFIPHDESDINLGFLVTENGLISCEKKERRLIR